MVQSGGGHSYPVWLLLCIVSFAISDVGLVDSLARNSFDDEGGQTHFFAPCHSHLDFESYRSDMERFLNNTNMETLMGFCMITSVSSETGFAIDDDGVLETCDVSWQRLMDMRERRTHQCEQRQGPGRVVRVALLLEESNKQYVSGGQWNAHALVLAESLLSSVDFDNIFHGGPQISVSIFALSAGIPRAGMRYRGYQISQVSAVEGTQQSYGTISVHVHNPTIQSFVRFLSHGEGMADVGEEGFFDAAIVTGPVGSAVSFVAGLPIVVDLMGGPYGGAPLGSDTFLHHNAILTPTKRLEEILTSRYENLAPVSCDISEVQKSLFDVTASSRDNIICLFSTAASDHTDGVTLQDKEYIKIIFNQDMSKTWTFVMVPLWGGDSAYSHMFQSAIPPGRHVLISSIASETQLQPTMPMECTAGVYISGDHSDWESGQRVTPPSVVDHLEEALPRRGVPIIVVNTGTEHSSIRVNGTVVDSAEEPEENSKGRELLETVLGKWMAPGGGALDQDLFLETMDSGSTARSLSLRQVLSKCIGEVLRHPSMDVEAAEKAIFPYTGPFDHRPLLSNRVYLDGCKPESDDLPACKDPLARRGAWVRRERDIWADKDSTRGGHTHVSVYIRQHHIKMHREKARWAWEVAGCTLHDYGDDVVGARACLKGKWIHFFGDSQDTSFWRHMTSLMGLPCVYPQDQGGIFAMCYQNPSDTVISFRFVKASSDTWSSDLTQRFNHVNRIADYPSSLVDADIAIANGMSRHIDAVIVNTSYWSLLKEGARHLIERDCPDTLAKTHRWMYRHTIQLIQLWRENSPLSKVAVRTGGLAAESRMGRHRKRWMNSATLHAAQSAVLQAATDARAAALDLMAMTEGMLHLVDGAGFHYGGEIAADVTNLLLGWICTEAE